ncbi:MAG TPA: hypothetical protein VIY08_00045 [Candidatus Nitrosocosmicus sp.]
MNNIIYKKSIIITSIIFMALLGSFAMIGHKASAETYTERYSKGMSQGYFDCDNGNTSSLTSLHLASHSTAYINGYDQAVWNCHHGIPQVTESDYNSRATNNGCDASIQTCAYNSDGTSHPISNNNNHVSQVDSTNVNPFPRHCDTGGWPSCYQTGYNAGFSDSNAGIGNGNCYGKHSANFCSGYSNGWQDAHSKDNIKSTNNNGNINSNNQNQTSKQGQLSTSNNINNQTFNPTNNQIFKPIINIINNPSSKSGSSSNTNSTSGSGSLSGSNSGSASSAGHNK